MLTHRAALARDAASPHIRPRSRRRSKHKSKPAGAAPVTGGTNTRWSGLMAAAQLGDRDSYRRLLAEIDPWLHRYFARRLPACSIEDAKQETLLVIHLRRHTYDQGRAVEPWIAGIARFKWIDHLRAIDIDNAALNRGVEIESIPADGAPDMDIGALTLHDLLDKLKPAQSRAIRMVKLEGFSIAEASNRTGESPSLVKINIHRGLIRMRALAELALA